MTSAELSALDEVHQLAKKTAALLRVAVAQLEDLSYLLDAASQAADAAVAVSDELATCAIHHRDAR